MQDFLEVKKSSFSHKAKKNRILCNPKISSFITFIFELLFDSATVIIPSFRMIKARCCKHRCQSDLFIGFCMHPIIQ